MAGSTAPNDRNSFLLRVANVNQESVHTHTDRVLYSAIGVFILLYFAYATVGGASFVDASSNYSHPWWRWLVGPLIACAVIAYDRAVVGRVAISYENLESDDPKDLLRSRSVGLYLGRGVLALLVAVIVTEPIMLDRYKGEIDAYLNQVHNSQAAQARSAGAIKGYEEEKSRLSAEDSADDDAVTKLRNLAGDKRAEAERTYQQALADNKGQGVNGKAGCPTGGYCDTLVQQSRKLRSEATELDNQAAALRTSQQQTRDARALRRTELDKLIRGEQDANLAAIKANAGFGARTAAMWHIVRSDFAGIGIFYLGTALLLIALDCAAVGLKLVSHGNAYERNEARRGRRRELEATAYHAHDLRATRAAADAYGEATSTIVASGISAAAEDDRLRDSATRRAKDRLREVVRDSMRGDDDERTARRTGLFRQGQPPRAEQTRSAWPAKEWPAKEQGFDDLEDTGSIPASNEDGTRRWTYN